ncbi:hypothetical protein KDA11_05000 [Candidatus Saccharibacteria bacterium]|nr:hypothetical protein [Candidatus Saccharibacteria bacterium]
METLAALFVLLEFYASLLLGVYLTIPIAFAMVTATDTNAVIYWFVLLVSFAMNSSLVGINYRCDSLAVRWVNKIIYSYVALLQIVMACLLLFAVPVAVPFYCQLVLYFVAGMNILALLVYLATFCFSPDFIAAIREKHEELFE